MKNLFIAVFLMICLCSCAQNEKSDFNNYMEVDRKPNLIQGDTISYMIVYRNKADSNETSIRFYEDSSYKTLMMEIFYHKGILNGPFRRFNATGKVELTGQYKNGLQQGQFISYKDGKVESYRYYDNGNKTGTWEEFDKGGKLSRRMKFIDDKMVEDQLFENDKLVKTYRY